MAGTTSLHLRRGSDIARRYLITNGFDGSLTMLGMMSGFYVSEVQAISVAISACMGAALALFISGLSSAYLSEKAEREKELKELEQALLADLSHSDYGKASRYLPVLVALVNGLAPFILSLVILLPLFFADALTVLPTSPYLNAMITALVCVFFLGILIGRINQTFWLWSGLRTLLTALVTAGLILMIGQFF